MGRATEELAARSGPGIGGLLNVTFGNAPELIIALFALNAGPPRGGEGVDHRLDHGQHVAGARGRDVRRRPAGAIASTSTARPRARSRSMLLLAAAALVMPAIYELVDGQRACRRRRAERVELRLDRRAVCRPRWRCVLIVSYVAGLMVLAEDPSRPLQPRRTRRTRRRWSRGRVRKSSSRWHRRRRGGRDVARSSWARSPRLPTSIGLQRVLHRRDRGGNRR